MTNSSDAVDGCGQRGEGPQPMFGTPRPFLFNEAEAGTRIAPHVVRHRGKLPVLRMEAGPCATGLVRRALPIVRPEGVGLRTMCGRQKVMLREATADEALN